MPRWLKVLLGIFISFIVIFIAAGLIFYNMLNSSLPLYEGDVNADGLNSTVEIYRDSMAIPYIIAQSEEDALYALGYVHAQERIFTMDMADRAMDGMQPYSTTPGLDL